ncbi:MAG: ABC transporter ATP-binding protein [bacterium]|nr:ABC transporter ATP-binding protein [bacterium]
MIPIVELLNISRTFGNLKALDKVDLTLLKGEIHSIVGSNGAGKSTLMKILYGTVLPDSGKILLEGREVNFTHPRDAIKSNISMVPQEILLVETHSVIQNIILGSEPSKHGIIDFKEAQKEIKRIINEYNIAIDLSRPLNKMSVGEKQKILIIRSLFNRSNILILDEPTASLTPREAEELFSILRSLKEHGSSIIFISHKIPEVQSISDRISVLRDGKFIGTVHGDVTDRDQIMEMICGTALKEIKRDRIRRETQTAPVYELREINSNHGAITLKNISFRVFPGEIFGIVGIDGNGQKELEEIVSGQLKNFSGDILMKDNSIKNIISSGLAGSNIGYIPSHREQTGLIGEFSIAENIILGRHNFPEVSNRKIMNRSKVTELSNNIINEYNIKPGDAGVPVSLLSGGNQQKVVLGREQTGSPEVLIACNPTRGIDIATINFLFGELNRLADSGSGILLMLTDVEDALRICDRLAIIYNGSIIKEFSLDETNVYELGFYMTGGKDE